MATATASGNNSIDDLQRRIAVLNTAAQRSTTITVILGIVAVIMLTFYFNYAYREVVDLTKPDSVVTMVDGVLSEHLPGARQALAEQIKQSSPEWAAELSIKAQESVPELRKGIETFVMGQVEERLAELELVSAEEFRKFLDDNQVSLRQQVQLLAAGKQIPEQTMQNFVDTFDQHFEVSFQETTAGVFESLYGMNDKLQRLHANQALTAEEQQERRLIMLAKAVQADNETSTK